MATPDERFDSVLLNVAGQLGGIEPLFDTVFSFLLRKTDYFHIMKPGDKMGFKPGVAQQLLLRSFTKFEQAAAAATKRAEAEKAKRPKPPPAAAAPKPAAEPPKPAAPAPAPAAAAPPPKPAAPAPAAAAPPPKPAPHSEKLVKAVGANSASHLAEQAGVPYNGGTTETYYWEQTINDVTLHAPVPPGTRARDVVCVIGKSHLLLKVKGQETPLIDGDYPCDARNGKEIWEKAKASECYWNVGEARGVLCVSIYLEKERESWWKSAIHGDAEIDTTKVDSTREVYDYDDETQGAIRKIMFDQHQKRLGKPTSDDMKNEDLLRDAWEAEGSPFKGQPFDPSRININGSGGSAPGLVPPPSDSDDAPVDVTES